MSIIIDLKKDRHKNSNPSAREIMVSFIVPAYNEEALIEKCLRSIVKEMQGSHVYYEIIVVDNGSTDRTVEIARTFAKVKIIQENSKGPTYARISGYHASRGLLIAYIDADNILPKHWLERAIMPFMTDTHLVALSGPLVFYDISRINRFFVQLFYYGNYLLYLLNRYVLGIGSMLQGGNFIVRREALEKIGEYHVTFPFYGDDTDLAWRLHNVGGVKFIWTLTMLSSGRRFLAEGIVKVGIRYAINFFWAAYLRRPFTHEWTDVRTEDMLLAKLDKSHQPLSAVIGQGYRIPESTC